MPSSDPAFGRMLRQLVDLGVLKLEREALSNPLAVTFDHGQIDISPIELQIVYKLRLAQAADSLSGKDFEDALHLYLTFEERFNTEQLETYVKELGVEDYYAELKTV